ncbi:hypothetical protein FRC02_003020 [Tulasnella sp. 418]|nr:hypothetical protein FRC02_003020 [Tulasnella sp. 418]
MRINASDTVFLLILLPLTSCAPLITTGSDLQQEGSGIHTRQSPGVAVASTALSSVFGFGGFRKGFENYMISHHGRGFHRRSSGTTTDSSGTEQELAVVNALDGIETSGEEMGLVEESPTTSALTKRDLGEILHGSADLDKRIKIKFPKPSKAAWMKVYNYLVGANGQPPALNGIIKALVKYLGDSENPASFVSLLAEGVITGAGIITFFAYMDEIDEVAKPLDKSEADLKKIEGEKKKLNDMLLGDGSSSSQAVIKDRSWKRLTKPVDVFDLAPERMDEIVEMVYSSGPLTKFEEDKIELRISDSFIPEDNKRQILEKLNNHPYHHAHRET